MCAFDEYSPNGITSLAWTPHEDVVPGLVSVIIPTYNRREYLLESVASVIRQTHRRIEIVVVDDGSDDGTEEAIRGAYPGLEMGGERRMVFIRQEHSGAQRARNKGILAARGEFVQFLDSDDVLAPDKLELQAGHMMAQPDIDMSVGQTCALEAPQQSLHAHREYARYDLILRSVGWSPFSTLGPVLRRRVLTSRSRAWDERLETAQDHEYFPRLILLGHSYGYKLDAKAYIRPADNRPRGGIHGRGSRGHDYWQARTIQLGSMWWHAPQDLRRELEFRSRMAWAALVVSRGLWASRDYKMTAKGIRWANNLSSGTWLWTLTRIVDFFSGAGAPSVGLGVFASVAFARYRIEGVRGRLSRCISR